MVICHRLAHVTGPGHTAVCIPITENALPDAVGAWTRRRTHSGSGASWDARIFFRMIASIEPFMKSDRATCWTSYKS